MADSTNHLTAKTHEAFALDGQNLISGENPIGMKNVRCEDVDRNSVTVAVDPLSKGDKDPDLECGRKINADVDECSIGGDSLWVSAKRLLNNLLIHLDFWSLGEAKTAEPTFCLKDLCKLPMDPHKTGVEVLSHKSENKNGGKNPRIPESRIESENLNLKPSGKKPPRPPKPPRLPKTCGDSSKDRIIKATLRRAKLEKLASLKKKQMHKSKTSSSSMWALVCTLCFCVIMVVQGLFSQGNSSAQITPTVPVRTETFHVHKYDNYDANGESLRAIIQAQPSSLHHFGPALDKARPVQSDLKS